MVFIIIRKRRSIWIIFTSSCCYWPSIYFIVFKAIQLMPDLLKLHWLLLILAASQLLLFPSKQYIIISCFCSIIHRFSNFSNGLEQFCQRYLGSLIAIWSICHITSTMSLDHKQLSRLEGLVASWTLPQKGTYGVLRDGPCQIPPKDFGKAWINPGRHGHRSHFHYLAYLPDLSEQHHLPHHHPVSLNANLIIRYGTAIRSKRFRCKQRHLQE